MSNTNPQHSLWDHLHLVSAGDVFEVTTLIMSQSWNNPKPHDMTVFSPSSSIADALQTTNVSSHCSPSHSQRHGYAHRPGDLESWAGQAFSTHKSTIADSSRKAEDTNLDATWDDPWLSHHAFHLVSVSLTSLFPWPSPWVQPKAKGNEACMCAHICIKVL